MFVTIEILIGLAFTYLMLSLMVTAFTEVVASLTGLRARVLRSAVRQLLDGPEGQTNTDKFYAHERILALSEGVKKPSYIPSATFADVVADMKATGGGAIKMPVLGAPPPDKEALEERFLDTMNRASGWYKRRASVVSGVLAIVVVVLSNADTLSIAHTLWASPTVRAAVVAQAERRVQMGRPRGLVDANYANSEDPVPAESDESAEELDEPDGITAEDRAVLESFIGWSSDFKTFNGAYCEQLQRERDEACRARADQRVCEAVLARIKGERRCEVLEGDLVPTAVVSASSVFSAALWPVVLGHLVGWTLSIAAVSLGAPFWFDTLSRFINVRGAGPAERPKHKGDLRIDRRTTAEAEATPTKENQE